MKNLVEDLWYDLRYALRMLRRAPVFTLAAVCSLAIGIGANAAVFSIADALLIRPLPIHAPEQVFFLERQGFDEQNLRFSYPGLERFRGVAEAQFGAMSSTTRMQATRDGNASFVLGQLVTGDWFDVLGVGAAAGRVLAPRDSAAVGDGAVVVLSHRYWTREFAADSAVVGKTIQLNRTAMTIVGVAAPEFDGVSVGERIDVWAPVTMQVPLHYAGNASINNADGRKPWLPQDGVEWLTVVTRIAPANLSAARARIQSIAKTQLDQRIAGIRDPDRRAFMLKEHVELLPGARGLSSLRDNFSQPLDVLIATAAIVLLIACANIAGLLLARNAARSREFALRLSLGARRGRLVRQLLTESLLLGLLSGAAAIVVARVGGQLLLRMASSTNVAIPLVLPFDWRLIGFTLGLSVTTGVLFGLVPALRWSRPGLADSLKAGARVIEGSGASRRFSFGKFLVVAQMALSLALLVIAVLFLRTFRNLLSAETGFDRDVVVSARFDPRLAGFSEAELPALYQRLLDKARAIPGVRSASLAMAGPVTGSQTTSSIVVEGRPPLPGNGNTLREDYVGPEYFATIGMTLVKGRDFADRDDAKAPKVVVVNEAMVRRFFGDTDPIGRHIGYGDPLDMEIIGVVKDAKVDGLRQTVPPMAFSSVRQHPDVFVRNLYVRALGSVDAIKGELTRAVSKADTNLAVREVVTLADLTARTVSRERLISQLTVIFGSIALVVACLGLYGTISYSVVRRTNEIGVRLALGASPSGVSWLVLRETVTLVALGTVAGLAVLWPTLHYLSTLMFGLSPRDPATLAGSSFALLAIGAIAGAIPAWRASRVNPLTALRAD